MLARLRVLIPVFCVVLFAVSSGFAEDVSSSYRVVPDWPKFPEGFRFGESAGVGVDSHNHVFVFHRGAEKPIACIDADSGEILFSFGEGMFVNAHGLEIDHEDNVWVTDTRTHQVYKFSHDGELLLTVGEKGKAGWDPTHFNQPTDVEVTPSGEFYVSDGYGNSRIAKFSADGKFLFDWGKRGRKPGEFNLPHGIALDDDGNVYIADRTNMRIQVFDAAGKFLRQWGAEQLGEEGRPWGLEVADDGHLYVIDGSDMLESTPSIARVTKLTLQGKVVDVWGAYGIGAGQFAWGHDVAVGRDGAVYTVEVRDGKRVQKFVKK